jgi:hypothetical protein
MRLRRAFAMSWNVVRAVRGGGLVLTRRTVLIIVGVLTVAGAAYTCWQAWQTKADLERAERSVSALRTAIDADDVAARDQAIADLQGAASTARDRTDGLWWGALTYLPLVGDDVEGVRVLSRVLDRVSAEGVKPLAASVDDLELLLVDDRIDVQAVQDLSGPVGEASAAFGSAADEINRLDPSGYVGLLHDRFVDFSEQVNDAASSLASAETATTVLPDMVGADGPRNYFIVFQNNAEIRATGGMPGSWAQIRAEDGALEMSTQGSAADFPRADDPVLPLTPEEVALYGPEIGTYFQDPGFTPDFPRAAELWRAHWENRFPEVELNGVLALDPVGMSYLLDGTGPVTVGDVTLTSDNLVEELLNKPYLELDPAEQDAFFAEAAQAIFEAATGHLESPSSFVEGLSRAAREGRFLVAPFDTDDAERLEGTNVVGALPTDDGETPFVDIGLNDATGSKMSYYLRYWVEIEPTSCAQDRQKLSATMKLSQSIRPDEAADLPISVTGGGLYGTDPGNQLIAVRIYGPPGGTIEDIRFDGRPISVDEAVEIDGRPAVTLAASVETRDDLVVTWSMLSGPGQTGDIRLGMTPGIVPGGKDDIISTACPV